MRTRFGVLTVCLVAILWAGAAQAAFDCFLHIEGIHGNVTIGNSKGWIRCINFTHTVPGLPKPLALCTSAVGGHRLALITRGTLRTGLGNIILTKYVDQTSDDLLKSTKDWRRFHRMRLLLCNMVNNQPEVLSLINLEECGLSTDTILAPGFGDGTSKFGTIDLTKPREVITIVPLRLNMDITRLIL